MVRQAPSLYRKHLLPDTLQTLDLKLKVSIFLDRLNFRHMRRSEYIYKEDENETSASRKCSLVVEYIVEVTSRESVTSMGVSH